MPRYFVYLSGQFLGIYYGGQPSGTSGVDWVEVFIAPGEQAGLKYWDFVEEEWYLPYYQNLIEEYRDQKIYSQVTYNDGTNNVIVTNDDLTRARLLERSTAMLLNDNDEDLTSWIADNGIFPLTRDHIQGLYGACTDVLYKAFESFAYVVNTHAVTPYDRLDDAKADFDTQMEV